MVGGWVCELFHFFLYRTGKQITCKIWKAMESKIMEKKWKAIKWKNVNCGEIWKVKEWKAMNFGFKVIIDNVEVKYFKSISLIKKYLKENKWASVRIYEYNENEYELIYFL